MPGVLIATSVMIACAVANAVELQLNIFSNESDEYNCQGECRRAGRFRAPGRSRRHAAHYDALGAPLFRVVRRGFLLEGAELSQLHRETVSGDARREGGAHETYRIDMPVDKFPWFYTKLQARFLEMFHEPLVTGVNMSMDAYSLRWSRGLMRPDAPIGYIHEDGDDMEMCADISMPREFANPQSSGWKWDDAGTCVAMLIGLRVPESTSGLAHSFVFAPDAVRGEPAPAYSGMSVEAVAEGELVTFNPYRYHSQYTPAGEADFGAGPMPKETRQQIVGFGLRQVPSSGSGRGRWILQRMCKGTSDPAVKRPIDMAARHPA
jgi:hypothetical protein